MRIARYHELLVSHILIKLRYEEKGGLLSFFFDSLRHFQIRNAKPMQPLKKVSAPLMFCQDRTKRVELGAAANA
jgi:hypothetical protein